MALRRLFLIFLLLTLSIIPFRAQEQEAWDIILYFESLDSTVYDAEIAIISPTGSETIDLPASLAPAGWSHTYNVSASDDGRFVAVHQALEGQANPVSLRIYDSQSETCCFDIGELLGGAEAFSVGGFEPNGTRFAVSYVNRYDPADLQATGGILIVDAANTSIVANFPMTDVNPQINAAVYSVWAYMGGWNGSLVLLAENCFACDGIIEGNFSAYDVNLGSFIADTGIPFSAMGERLDATNELLYLTQDTRFSYDPSPGIMAIPNVVQYNPTIFSPSPNGKVIYASNDVTYLGEIVWISDGFYFLVDPFGQDFWDIVSRQGTAPTRIIHPEGERVLAGVPAGFITDLIQADTSVAINLWTADGSFSEVFRSAPNRFAAPANLPFLGMGLEGVIPFPEVIPTGEITVQCNGFLPSRLRIGEQGRVTPGEPNRLREYAGTDATQIGEIPGEAVFDILEGPVCDEMNQIAWWRVTYNGIEGWTAEGQGTDYWTEPLN